MNMVTPVDGVAAGSLGYSGRPAQSRRCHISRASYFIPITCATN